MFLSLGPISSPHLSSKELCLLFQNWLDPSKEIKKQIRSEWPAVAGNMVGEGVGGSSRPQRPRLCCSHFEKCLQTHELLCCMWQILWKVGHFVGDEPETRTREVTV